MVWPEVQKIGGTMSRLLSDEALADQAAVQAVINTTNCTFIEALKSLEIARWTVDEAIKIVYNRR